MAHGKFSLYKLLLKLKSCIQYIIHDQLLCCLNSRGVDYSDVMTLNNYDKKRSDCIEYTTLRYLRTQDCPSSHTNS